MIKIDDIISRWLYCESLYKRRRRWMIIVGFVLLERMGGRGRVSLVLGTPFHTDFNELLFVSIALTLMEISVDFDHS